MTGRLLVDSLMQHDGHVKGFLEVLFTDAAFQLSQNVSFKSKVPGLDDDDFR